MGRVSSFRQIMLSTKMKMIIILNTKIISVISLLVLILQKYIILFANFKKEYDFSFYSELSDKENIKNNKLNN